FALFFVTHTPTTVIYTLSLHDALPISSSQRWALRTVNKDTDKIKPIETLLSHSLATFEITKASVGNLQSTDLPFVYNYSVTARKDRKSTRLNSSHVSISYAVFCLKKKK